MNNKSNNNINFINSLNQCSNKITANTNENNKTDYNTCLIKNKNKYSSINSKDSNIFSYNLNKNELDVDKYAKLNKVVNNACNITYNNKDPCTKNNKSKTKINSYLLKNTNKKTLNNCKNSYFKKVMFNNEFYKNTPKIYILAKQELNKEKNIIRLKSRLYLKTKKSVFKLIKNNYISNNKEKIITMKLKMLCFNLIFNNYIKNIDRYYNIHNYFYIKRKNNVFYLIKRNYFITSNKNKLILKNIIIKNYCLLYTFISKTIKYKNYVKNEANLNTYKLLFNIFVKIKLNKKISFIFFYNKLFYKYIFNCFLIMLNQYLNRQNNLKIEKKSNIYIRNISIINSNNLEKILLDNFNVVKFLKQKIVLFVYTYNFKFKLIPNIYKARSKKLKNFISYNYYKEKLINRFFLLLKKIKITKHKVNLFFIGRMYSYYRKNALLKNSIKCFNSANLLIYISKRCIYNKFINNVYIEKNNYQFYKSKIKIEKSSILLYKNTISKKVFNLLKYNCILNNNFKQFNTYLTKIFISNIKTKHIYMLIYLINLKNKQSRITDLSNKYIDNYVILEFYKKKFHYIKYVNIKIFVKKTLINILNIKRKKNFKRLLSLFYKIKTIMCLKQYKIKNYYKLDLKEKSIILNVKLNFYHVFNALKYETYIRKKYRNLKYYNIIKLGINRLTNNIVNKNKYRIVLNQLSNQINKRSKISKKIYFLNTVYKHLCKFDIYNYNLINSKNLLLKNVKIFLHFC